MARDFPSGCADALTEDPELGSENEFVQQQPILWARRSITAGAGLLAIIGLFSIGATLNGFKLQLQQGETALFAKALPNMTTELQTRRTALTSGSHELNKRAFHVKVPPGRGRFPVLILLHGRGGTGKSMINMFSKKARIASKYILVAPDGPSKSWNIVDEPSKENDAGYVGTTLVNHLVKFSNVQPRSFVLLGNSNGAALTNRILIEINSNRIKGGITCVSQLNIKQYQDGKFRVGGNDNTYQTSKKPRKRKVLQLTGGKDRLIPAAGGKSRVGGGGFIAWDKSAYYYAQAFGHKGAEAKVVDGGSYSRVTYLGGSVKAYNYKNEAHGLLSTGKVDGPLLTFLGV